ncbi:RNA polymerase sigma factor [Nitriliruptor sp.]|uniref:RNA polymerase sigma factor n=1 Tax=Nitriliruptor sp. TaxID=2448056 RepID=UPI0034A0914F
MRWVALNLATSRYRRRRAEWRANRRHGEPDTRIEETAVSLAVRDAVAALPPRQRTVIALRFFVGLDVAQTATEMGCAHGIVKSLTSKAMTRLRDQLPHRGLEHRPNQRARTPDRHRTRQRVRCWNYRSSQHR